MKRILTNLSLAALALTGCTQTELTDTNAGMKGMIDYALYAGRPTRAAALDNTNFAKFKIYSYQNIEDTNTPNTFAFSDYYDETVEKDANSAWAGPRPRRWPTGEKDFLNFYAYSDEVNTSNFTKATSTTVHPTFKYTVPTDATKQEDLLVAASFNQTEKTNQGKLNMDFKHALTQVVFKVKSSSPSFTVKVSKVELIGANSEGTFAYDGAATVGGWNGQTTTADYAFTVETPAKLDDQAFVTLTSANGNLMMLPDADPKEVKIRVTYTLDDDPDVLVKEIKLETESATAGPNQTPVTPVTPWVMGKRIAYNLTLPGKANEIIFGDATMTEDWSTEDEVEAEAKDVFGVSFVSVDGLRNGNAGFELEINDNRQTAGTFSLSSVDNWVKFSETADSYASAKNPLNNVSPATRAIIAKKVYVYADNNTTGAQRKATITMTRADYSTVTLELIQEAPTANLSGANSYIITTAGNNALDATIKGNGKQVKLPLNYNTTNPATDIPLSEDDLKITGATKAEVLWETVNTTSAPAVGTVVKNVSYVNGIIFFTTTATQGNAVIVLKNSSNKVLWSWHIWRTDEEPKALEMNPLTATEGTFDATKSNTISGIKVMDRNLGALNATPQSDLSAGLYYQWGRPVPFPGVSSLTKNTSTLIAVAGIQTTLTTGAAISPEEAIGIPATFYTNANGGDWTSRNDNLWGTPLTSTLKFNKAIHSSNAGHKTIYDPCPKGWRIAPSYVYANALHSSGGTFNKGYSFTILKTGDLWMPAAGSYDQIASTTGVSGFYWASSIAPLKVDQANKLFIDENTGAAEFYDYRSRGFTCRCIKE